MKHPPDCHHCEVVRGGTRPVVPAIDRFNAKVCRDDDGCLMWIGGVTRDGYGMFWDGKRYVRVHRYAWSSVNGEIPAGLGVLHHCDKPLCVEPSHLFVGTAADNSADMVAKGRAFNGRGRQRNARGQWLPA